MAQTISPTVLVATKRRKKIDNIQNLLITIWPLVGFMLFGFIPMVVSLYMSLTDAFDTDLANAVFVGFKNFEYVLQWEGHVWYAYANTLIFLASVPVTIFVSLFIANLVNNARFGKRFFRSVLFIPYICSTVVVAFSFRML